MYEMFYGMTGTPFSRNIPTENLYISHKTEEALGRLKYAADRQLFTVVMSDPGCGKSTLIRKFSAILPKDHYQLLYVSDSKLTPRYLYAGLLDQMGLESHFYRGEAKKALQRAVDRIQNVQKKQVVCVLDEAHLLDKV